MERPNMAENVRRSVEAARAAARQAVQGVKAAKNAKEKAIQEADQHLNKPLVPYIPLDDEDYTDHYKVSILKHKFICSCCEFRYFFCIIKCAIHWCRVMIFGG
jgi:hypothetical protein